MTDEVRRFKDKEHAAFFARFINDRDERFQGAEPVQLKSGEWAVSCTEDGASTLFPNPLSYMMCITEKLAAALHARRLKYTELVKHYASRRLTAEGIEGE